MKVKQLNIILVGVLGTLIVVSCQKRPDVSVEASATDVMTGETVTFTNKTSDAHRFEWLFGDGNTSSNRTPSHAWLKSGTYEVTATGFNNNDSKLDREFLYIVVNSYPSLMEGNYTSVDCTDPSKTYAVTLTTQDDYTMTLSNYFGGDEKLIVNVSKRNLTISKQAAQINGQQYNVFGKGSFSSSNMLSLEITIQNSTGTARTCSFSGAKS